jgi:hypothetical protein
MTQAFAHQVFFTLTDNSAAARQTLLAACRKHLAGHPGTISFAVGTLAGECRRPVNDRDFDVSLHVVFQDKAAHDQYQHAPRHLQFIEENQGNWKRVRVFDSHLENEV